MPILAHFTNYGIGSNRIEQRNDTLTNHVGEAGY